LRHGDHVELRHAGVVVVSRRDPRAERGVGSRGRRIIACRTARPDRQLLNAPGNTTAEPLAARQPFVAYRLSEIFPSDPAGTETASDLIVLDLARRRDYVASFAGQRITQAVLRPTGSVAYIREREAGVVAPTDLVACPMPACYDPHREAQNYTDLDTGAIDPGSLAIHGTNLTWSNAGIPKTATLD
jgi:hypothetical protein